MGILRKTVKEMLAGHPFRFETQFDCLTNSLRDLIDGLACVWNPDSWGTDSAYLSPRMT